ncbi:MAG: M67 family metallopeptidase [Acidimicrobiia bacterium]
MRVRVPDRVREAILAHAADCAPDECCGLLAADGDGRISFAYLLSNTNPSPVSYTVDPDEHFHALRHAESMGWEIAGVFHSHPNGPATPSMVDVQAALDPGWMYLIAAPGEIRGFWIRESGVEEIGLD